MANGRWLCSFAAQAGDLEALRWMRGRGVAWDELTPAKAAEGGHLHVLKYVRGCGCPWEQQTQTERQRKEEKAREKSLQTRKLRRRMRKLGQVQSSQLPKTEGGGDRVPKPYEGILSHKFGLGTPSAGSGAGIVL